METPTHATPPVALDRLVLPFDEPEIHVQAFYQKGEPPFICGVRGGITQDVFVEIEQDMIENPEMFERGDGDYLFRATRQEGQQTYLETGQWDFLPHWELDLIHFRQNEIAQTRAQKESK